jgi:hypothetical protein
MAAEAAMLMTRKRPASSMAPADPSDKPDNTTTPMKKPGHHESPTYSVEKHTRCDNNGKYDDDADDDVREADNAIKAALAVAWAVENKGGKVSRESLVPTSSWNGHGSECPTLGLNTVLEATQDDGHTDTHNSDQTSMIDPRSAGALTHEVHDGLVVVPRGQLCFQILAGTLMPPSESNNADDDWPRKVGSAIAVGVENVARRLGGWTMGDMRMEFILLLLEDHSSDIEQICRNYHVSLENPVRQAVAKSSKTLVTMDGFNEKGIPCLNRFSLKSDYQLYTGRASQSNQMVLRLMGSNKSGHKRQLGQITLHLHEEKRVYGGDDLGQQWTVLAHHRPFVATMLLRGVMQAIHWYHSQGVLLPEGQIRRLIMVVKASLEYDKIHARPRPLSPTSNS